MGLSCIDFDIKMADVSELFNVEKRVHNVIKRRKARLRIPGARKHFDSSLMTTPSREPI